MRESINSENTMESSGLKKIVRPIFKFVYPVVKFYWFIFRPTGYGVRCVIEHNGKVLMIRHTYGKGSWMFPGGGVDKNESPEKAIQREVFEEVGITIKAPKLIGEFVDTTYHKQDHVTAFKAESSNGTFKIDELEIREARWFPSNNLPKLSDYTTKILSLWKQA